MRKNKNTFEKGTVIFLASILLVTTAVAIKSLWLKASPSPIFVGPVPPANYATIQEAINNAQEGDIIEVMDEGSPYVENVVVNKSVIIERWTPSKPECIVDGNFTGPVFNVTASNVSIFNFTIQKGDYGIYLSSSSDNNIIIDNRIASNSYGLFIETHSRNNTLIRNSLTNSYRGFGIGIDPESSSLDDLIQNIDNSTTINSRPIYYWVNKHDQQIPTNAGYVALINSTNIKVKNFTVGYNDYGILIAYTNQSSIENMTMAGADTGIYSLHSFYNTINASFVSFNGDGIRLDSSGNVITGSVITDNSFGIHLFNASYNVLAGNNITRCYPGIVTQYSNYNVFYHNNMMNGAGYQRFRDFPSTPWDNGMEGNYWNDFQGPDENGDGIIDTPYNPVSDAGSPDRYPLVEPWNTVKSPLNVTYWKTPWDRTDYLVVMKSDHVVGPIDFSIIRRSINFNVTAGSGGYFNVTIPRNRLDYPFHLYINGSSKDFADYESSFSQDYNYVSLYYSYPTAGFYNITIVSYVTSYLIGDLTGPPPTYLPDGKIDMRDVGFLLSLYLKTYP